MLKVKVGMNAGRIWRLLDLRASHSGFFKEVGKELGLSDSDLMLALGWLAREEKIEFSDAKKGADSKITLHYTSDFYF